MDIDTIPFGVDFREHLDQAVRQCDVLLAVMGDTWLDMHGNVWEWCSDWFDENY